MKTHDQLNETFNNLAALLVTPERYGRVALMEVDEPLTFPTALTDTDTDTSQ